MSENGENVRVKDGQKIRIELDRTEEMKELQEKNEELETTLKLIAEKEFQAKCKQVGLDPSQTTPEILKDELKKKAPRGNSDETTNFYSQGQQTGKAEPLKVDSEMPLSWLEFDSTEQAISTLNKLKKEGSPQQKKESAILLSKLEKKAFSKNKQLLDVEFSDDIHALTRHEITIPPNATPEEAQKIEAYNAELRRKRSNWIQRE
jgi:hypothetical protein